MQYTFEKVMELDLEKTEKEIGDFRYFELNSKIVTIYEDSNYYRIIVFTKNGEFLNAGAVVKSDVFKEPVGVVEDGGQFHK